MQNKKEINAIFSFVAYPWNLHNQFDVMISSLLSKNNKLKKILILCDGKNKDIQAACENIKNIKEEFPLEKKSCNGICKLCLANNRAFLSKFYDKVFLLSELAENKNKNKNKNKNQLKILIRKPNKAISPLFTRYRASSLEELKTFSKLKKYINKDISESFKAFINSKSLVHQAIKKLNSNGFKASTITMFNGRLVPYNGFFDQFKKEGYKVILHERGATKGSIRMCLNNLANDTITLSAQIKRDINDLLTDDQVKEISNFMIDRVKGKNLNNLSFQGSKSVEIKIKNKVITFFSSSMDELSSKDENLTYENQLKQIEKLAKKTNLEQYNLILRQHPNLGKINSLRSAELFLEECQKLSKKYNFKIIEPFHKKEWMELANISDLMVVPSSSLFIDARFFGYPLVSPNPSQFESFLNEIDYSFYDNPISKTINELNKKKVIREKAIFARKLAYEFYIKYSHVSKLLKIKNLYQSNLHEIKSFNKAIQSDPLKPTISNCHNYKSDEIIHL